MLNPEHALRVFCLVISIVSSLALYEDQIGKFDWRQKYVGIVNKAIFDSKSSGRKLIVATEQNVLATLDPRDGVIAWRQIYESGINGVINFVSQQKGVVSISGYGKYLRFWDPNSGTLVSEHSTPLGEHIQKDDLLSYSPVKNVVLGVHFKENMNVILYKYSVDDGNNIEKEIVTPWRKSDTRCAITNGASLVCIDPITNSIHIANLLEDVVSFEAHKVDHVLTKITEVTESVNNILVVKFEDSTLVIKVEKTKLSILKYLGNEVIKTSVAEANEYLLIFIVKKLQNNGFEVSVFSTETNEYNGDLTVNFELQEHHGEIDMVAAHLFYKKDGRVAFRMFISTSDHSLIMINHSGKMLWSRDEALAAILNVEMLELPVSEMEARFEEEFGANDGNVIKMFFQRITSQFHQLKTYLNHLFTHLLAGEVASTFSSEKTNKLVRDEFNLHKIIVATTSSGKLFGIDNLSGEILWRKYIPELTTFISNSVERMPLFVQRTTAHFLNKPQCVVFGVQKDSVNTMMYVFDPITGLPVLKGTQGGIIRLPFKVIQTSLMHFHDNHFLKPILMLDSLEKLHVFPEESADLVKEHRKSFYMFTADVQSGVISGYRLYSSEAQPLSVSKMWKVSLPTNAHKIVSVVSKRSIERVHSQGRVMGDRSVLFKYSNPNLAVVVTEGSDSGAKPYIYLYLIDVVSGQIVHSVIHRRAHGPVHVVHSENWIVYSYQSEKSRRTEIAVLEMFEGKSQSNTTIFSSLHPPILPIVEKQAYVFPVSSISAMADTITEKGMTNKHVLVALSNGGILEVPKFFLDPRRPIVMTNEFREEGLLPYIPELPIPPEHIINYNQSVAKVNGIYTVPAGLESTCLVFVYGLDLFYTRTMPSKTFDVLKDDFDHYLISLVLLGLIAASYGTKRLAAHKALKQAWK